MKSEIKVGGHYIAKVSGRLTTVCVDKIRQGGSLQGGFQTVYDVTNLATGRKTTFRSAQKFHREVDYKPARTKKSPEGVVPKLADKLRYFETIVDKSPHLVIEACAGTGKTTTLIEALNILETGNRSIIPSPQQQAIWDAICLVEPEPKTICFVAFNKSIATELQQRVPGGCDAMTMHSMGFRSVRQRFDSVKVNSYRVQDIIAELLEKDIREIRRNDLELLKATEKLVGLCKMTLIASDDNELVGDGTLNSALVDLAAYYDVDLNGNSARVFGLVPRVLERCKDVNRDDCIDFNDMIWLPVVLNLPVFRYDLLLVDEAQDLNRCQQALALRAGRRLILCGDPKQAIYQFAGADSESMDRMMKELSLTDRGCEYLPLTVTRRCGKAIVAEAQKIVPDFEAHETCCEGKVSHNEYLKENCEFPLRAHYSGYVQNGDMVLCRVNAPLVSECFKFLRDGRKANIQGRDIGQGLISTIQKLVKGDPGGIGAETTYLVRRLSDWLYAETIKENAKRNPSEARLIALQDRYDCLICFCEDQTTVEMVVKRIENIFTDDKNGEGIKMSSIHKAKGLEAKRVFILEPEGATIPHPMAKSEWQRDQEYNLLYVAITRAIEELVYVS